MKAAPNKETLKLKLLRGDQSFAYFAIAPAASLILSVMVYPIAYVVYLSFTPSDGIVIHELVGLDNYVGLLEDSAFWRVMLNNLIFLLSVPLILTASLLCAVLMYEGIWGQKVFRILFFIPSVISTVVIGILFRTLFAYDGPVNRLLAPLGIPRIDWLASGGTAMTVIIIALVWGSFGYGMLILLAGMANIDPNVYDAARLDGANWFQRVRYITLPLILKVMGFLSVINVIYTFASLFGFIFVMTSGGPGYATTTLDYFIYLKMFSGSDLGSGAALAVILFFIIIVLTAVQLRIFGTGADVD